MARLAEAQLAEDGTYPGAEAVFAGAGGANTVADFDPNQPATRRGGGRRAAKAWAAAFQSLPSGKQAPAAAKSAPASKTEGALGWLAKLNPVGTASAQEVDPEEGNRGLGEDSSDPSVELRIERYVSARNALEAIDPNNQELFTLTAPGYIPSETNVQRVEAAAEAASIKRVCDFVFPNGEPIGQPGTDSSIRELSGGIPESEKTFDYLDAGGTPVPFVKGSLVRLPANAGVITLRPVTSSLAPDRWHKCPGNAQLKL